MHYEWTEMAYLELQAGNTAMIIFGFAVVMVFLVLAAQYESWSLPLAVILVVPMCLLSAVIGVTAVPAVCNAWPPVSRLPRLSSGVSHTDINIFTQIGFVVLVGTGQQERHPDRRVRQAARRERRPRAARPPWTPASCACGRS